jgi:hypothetical protein
MSLTFISLKRCNYLPQITAGRSWNYAINFTILNKLAVHMPAAGTFPRQVDA